MPGFGRWGLLVAAFAIVLSAPVLSQPFPGGKPIELTVMFGAGSAADVTARQLANGMSKFLHAPVPVVNRTGAAGALGYVYVSQRKPDGYSLIWNSNSISTTYHSGALSFNYTAFDPVARVVVENPALAVKTSSPWKTLKELIDYAHAYPRKVRVGNSGTGSHTHIASVAVFSTGGSKIVAVPFGSGQAIVNLLGDRIEAVVQFLPALTPHVRSGELRLLGMLGAARDPAFPAVPTAKEQGYDITLDMWRGIAVPRGTPRSVVATLQEAIEKTVKSLEFRAAGKNLGFNPAFLPAEAFAKIIADDDRRLAEVMKHIGLKH